MEEKQKEKKRERQEESEKEREREIHIVHSIEISKFEQVVKQRTGISLLFHFPLFY